MLISNLETHSDEDYKTLIFHATPLLSNSVKYEHLKYLTNVDFAVTNHNNEQEIQANKKRHK